MRAIDEILFREVMSLGLMVSYFSNWSAKYENGPVERSNAPHDEEDVGSRD